MDVKVTQSQNKNRLFKISKGDENAFKELFILYKDRFYGAALKMTRSPEVSEEIVQEVFVKIWTQRRLLDDIDRPESYLFSIVYHSISAHFKKIAREKLFKEKWAEVNSCLDYTIEKEVEEKEMQLFLQELLLQLPPRQRRIYQLSKQEGLSRNEIAEKLGISPNTVKNHLLKAIKFLRMHWNEAYLIFLCFFLLF